MGHGFGILEKREERIGVDKSVGCVPVGGFTFVGWKWKRKRKSVEERRKWGEDWLWRQTVRSEADDCKADHQSFVGAYF